MTTTQAGVVLRHVRGLVAAEQTSQAPDRQLLERFAARREEAAFAALVRRHGPLVLGVCRRVLHDGHDAEDAFQAAFLALARNPGAVGARGSVGGWLHRVAYRTAVKARARAAARQRHEQRADQRPPTDPLAEVTGRELIAVLDDELQKLPEKYRAPLVLCYLEGLTGDAAARQLGCSVRTLKRRLADARECLRDRLTRRGLALPAALLVAGLAGEVGTAAVPAPLVAATVKAALAAGKATPVLAATAAGALAGASATKTKIAAAVVLLIGTLLLGVGTLTRPAQAQRPAEEAPAPPAARPPGSEKKAPPAAAEPAKAETMRVAGRVLTAAGKPAAGAQVAVVADTYARPTETDNAAWRRVLGSATADDDGRYRLDVPQTSSQGTRTLHVLAALPGLGLGWVRLDDVNARRHEAEVKLPPEQVVRRRLIDLQGQPAAGVKVFVTVVANMKAGKYDGPQFYAPPEGLKPWPGPFTTDERGRVTIRGVGPGLTVRLRVRDDRFAQEDFVLQSGTKDDTEEPTLTLEPARVIEGRITAADTGKPLAGARLVVEAGRGLYDGRPHGYAHGKTDADGRFRIVPFPGEHVALTACPAAGQPYLPLAKTIDWPKAAVKQEVNLALPRGVLVRCMITEEGSGKPVAGASAGLSGYEAEKPGPSQDVSHALEEETKSIVSGADGVLRLPLPPGKGRLLIKGPTPDYVHVETSWDELAGGKPGGTRYYPDGVVKLEVKAGAETVDVAVKLRRGVTVKARVVGPDGKPVARAVALCRTYVPFTFYYNQNTIPVRDGAFELPGLDPEKAYPVFVLDAANGHGAAVEFSGKQAGGEPVTVKLAACGSVRARLVDAAGRPVAKHVLADPPYVFLNLVVTPGPSDFGRASGREPFADSVIVDNIDRTHYHGLRTDEEGRVTFPNVIPGATYRVIAGEDDWVMKKEFTVKPGQALDLGDVKLQAGAE